MSCKYNFDIISLYKLLLSCLLRCCVNVCLSLQDVFMWSYQQDRLYEEKYGKYCRFHHILLRCWLNSQTGGGDGELSTKLFHIFRRLFPCGCLWRLEWLFCSADVWWKTTSMLMHLSRFVTQWHRIDLHDLAVALSSQTELVENILENYKGTSHNFCLTHTCTLTDTHSKFPGRYSKTIWRVLMILDT